ncbi:MAG: AAA family ATPase, partial [Bacteroidota bacterium]
MLKRLVVQNYAIINHVSLDFVSGFNVITGETGAGKSILLGALNLIRGGRADTKVLYDRNVKCIVEAT